MLRFLGAFAVLGAALATCTLSAQPAPADVQPVMLILDVSGSMNRPIGTVPKIAIAKDVVRDLLARWPAGRPVGMTLYGHRRPRDCSDIEQVRAIGPLDAGAAERMRGMVAGLAARGETPIARTLTGAIPAFGGRKGRIILVTDGREECGGDVCAAAAELARAGIDLTVDIVGFDLRPEEKAALQCVTERTGGRYFDAADRDGLAAALGRATAGPDLATLEVTVTESGRRPTEAARVTIEGGTHTGLALTGNPVRYQLAPGSYRVTAQVANGPASAPVEVSLAKGELVRRTIDIGSGTLVVALVAADGRPIPRGPQIQLRDGDRLIAALNEERARFQAPPGRYTVRVQLTTGAFQDHAVEIRGGETVERRLTAEIGTVEVTVGGRFAAGRGPFPYVELQQDGRFVTALADNPARFTLFGGRYAAGVRIDGALVGMTPVEVRGGTVTPVTIAVP
ncbi:VWA domain-containing protein [Stella sp.]|uniref:vWA domain-containing protein n=1 Tax=Stella sp. TaxID=2912054 RepID=UPI0035B4A8F3